MEDLRREGMFAGVIVTAVGLSSDAQRELQGHNAKDMDLCHNQLEDLLSGEVSCNTIQFLSGNLSEKLKVSLREYLASPT
ncbi:hypothetical protein PN462_14385 [Spirulina sp. CS-785/01]|uniref:hypothetical protein n=1 Tax=Spirulina sp. CS-785/01 TaxID=3021716 RepID=UPI00232EC5E8|nr:hypothetical protein [Spirulina sp. CS-785/01]MDB9314298.1 hypothetical protein [Spirulina sp. CS-785/01]